MLRWVRLTLRHGWPLLVALAALVALLLSLNHDLLERTGGHFIYTLDDTYIHMAMAKNFAAYGVWGVTRHEFTSATSSPLWTLLLAVVYRVGGVHDRLPFWLNLVSAVALLGIAFVWLKRARVWSGYTALALVGLVWLVPLPTMIFTAMEHTLHHVFVALFLWLAALSLAAPNPTSRRTIIGLSILAALLMPTRYESAFIILPVALLAVLRWRPVAAAAMLVAGGLPVAIYGWISQAHGWFFIPATIAMKNGVLHVTQNNILELATGYRGLSRIADDPHLVRYFLIVMALFTLRYLAGRNLWRVPTLVLAVTIGAATLHYQFINNWQFYRYESYLYVLLVLGAGLTLSDSPAPPLDRARRLPGQLWRIGQTQVRDVPGILFRALRPARMRAWKANHPLRWLPLAVALVFTTVVLFVPLLERADRALREVPLAATNIYEQQYQMARFVAQYYDGATLMMNDIGLVNYLADIRLVDLAGLGTAEVARLRRAGFLDTNWFHTLADTHDVDLAIIYETWFEGIIPRRWTLVARWFTPESVVLGGSYVSFFAVRAELADELALHLLAFTDQMDARVQHLPNYVPGG